MPTNEELLAWNGSVVEEFRAHGGHVRQPPFPILLLTTTGARSGRRIATPLAYQRHDERLLVVASGAGSSRHPAWFRNLKSDPAVTVELEATSFDATAVELHGPERDRLFAAMSAANGAYRDYEDGVDRIFPVVELVPASPVKQCRPAAGGKKI